MTRDSAFGFVIGMAAGAALGMLSAPKSRGEVRRFLKAKTKETRDAIGDVVDQGRSELSRKTEGLTNAVGAGKKAYRESAG